MPRVQLRKLTSDGGTGRGVVKTCDKNNRPLDQQAGVRAINGCLGGNGYMCDEFQPVPVSADLSYGFVYMISDAQTENHPNCCKCVEITWQSGPAAGKQMIAQVVTPGGSGGDIKRNDLIVLIPGGGLGPLSAGCPAQYGRDIRWWVSLIIAPAPSIFPTAVGHTPW